MREGAVPATTTPHSLSAKGQNVMPFGVVAVLHVPKSLNRTRMPLRMIKNKSSSLASSIVVSNVPPLLAGPTDG